jgi:hypothetical protein
MATILDTACPAGGWTKVAANMKVGRVAALDLNATACYYAVVATGALAPTLLNEGTLMRGSMVADSSTAVDVYYWPVGADSSARSTIIT